MGVLTQFLLEKGHDLTVVELDMESVDYLEQNFPVLEGKILAEDFLRLDLGKLFPDQFCVIGNYPYNISSQIFFKVLDYKEHIPYRPGTKWNICLRSARMYSIRLQRSRVR